MKNRYFLFSLILSCFFACQSAPSQENNPDSTDTTTVAPPQPTDNLPPNTYRLPYSPGMQTKHADPSQVDFSQDYLQCLLKRPDIEKDATTELLKYDFSKIWSRKSRGVIDKHYRRIDMEFTEIIRDEKNQRRYRVKGHSLVGTNKCRFEGIIHVSHIAQFNHGAQDLDEPPLPNTIAGMVFCRYSLRENKEDPHSGQFRGIMGSKFYIDTTTQEVHLDNLSSADYYTNNEFVGTWTNYETGEVKKCIWADDRLPFTFDFDIGAGEMIVNDKYKENGW